MNFFVGTEILHLLTPVSAFLPTDFKIKERTIIAESLVQFLNAELPITLTAQFTITDFKLEQFSNALLPIAIFIFNAA